MMSVTGNSLTIANSDAVPRPADGTDFGNTSVGGNPVVQSFTIQNTGPAPLSPMAARIIAAALAVIGLAVVVGAVLLGLFLMLKH